jgi:nucleoside-diphosphate-sugar epimerase
MHGNLIHAVLDAKIRPHLIFLGSCAEYGFSNFPFTENLNPNPLTNYGKSKWNQTKRVLQLNNSEDPPWTIIRPSVVYGPNQKQNLVLPQIIDALFLRKSLELTGGSQTRDFIFVEDLVLALKDVMLINQSVFSEIINIGYGKSIKIKDLAIDIANLMGVNYTDYLLFNSLPKKDYDLEKYEVNIDKAKKLLKWEPKIKLQIGLQKTLAARVNGNKYNG